MKKQDTYLKVFNSTEEAKLEYEQFYSVSDIAAILNYPKKSELKSSSESKQYSYFHKKISELRVGKIVKNKKGEFSRTTPQFSYGFDWFLVLPNEIYFTESAFKKIKMKISEFKPSKF